MKEKIEIVTQIFLKILTGIVTILIFFALYGFIQISIMNKDYANYFGYSPFEVKSGSMRPTINKSDMVIVKLTKNIKKNDIITFKVDTSYVTHRVTEIRKNSIITKGDYNNYEDRTTSKKFLVGKVVKVFPKFGIWKKIVLSPVVIIALLFAILLFSIGFSYEDKNKPKNKHNDKIKLILKNTIEYLKKNYNDLIKGIKRKDKNKVNRNKPITKKKVTNNKKVSKNNVKKEKQEKSNKKSEVKEKNKKVETKSKKVELKKQKGNKTK